MAGLADIIFIFVLLCFGVKSLKGKDCNQPLGLAHRNTVKDSQFKSSSNLGKHLPVEGRLGNNYHGWCSQNATNHQEWIEINFMKFVVLTQVEIEGIQDGKADYYVKKFKLHFSYDGMAWYKYSKSVEGNDRAVGVKQIKLEHQVKAKYMRIYPEDCHGQCCLKLEAYGCQKDIKPDLTVEQRVQSLAKGGQLSVTCTARGQPGVNIKIKVMKNGKKSDITTPGDSIHKVSNQTNALDQIIVEKKVVIEVTYDVREILSLYTCKAVGDIYDLQGFNCSGKYFCDAGYEDPSIGTDVEKEFMVVLKEYLTLPKPPIVITLNPSSRSVYVEWKIPSFGDIPITKYQILHKLKSERRLVFKDGPTVDASKMSATMDALAPYTDYNLMIVAYLPEDVKRITPSKSARIQSSIFRFKTDVAGPSAAPVSVEIIELTSRTVKLTWQEPPHDTWNGPLDGYGVFYTRVEYGGTALKAEPRQSKLSNGKSTSISLNNLVPWSSYIIELYAFNIKEDGSSALGVIKNVTVRTNVDAPSKAPIGLSFIASDSESATLKWKPPMMNSANGPIDGYFITFYKIRVGNLAVKDPGEMRKKVNKSEINGFVLSGLDSWCTYRISVAAYNEFQGKLKISPRSPYLLALTQVNEPTISSRNLTTKDIKSRSVSLVWQPPSPDAANGPINGYIVFYRRLKMGSKSLSNIRFRTKPVQTFDHTGYTLDGLLPWSTYDVRLSAYNTLGDRYLYSKEKESIMVDTTVDRPGSPPENLRNITVGNDQVELQWEDPPADDWHGPIDGYRLFMKRLKIGPYKMIGEAVEILDLNRTKAHGPWKVPNLAPWTTYTIKVSAFNRRGGSVLLSYSSNSIEIVTDMAKPSGAPSRVKVLVTSSTSFSVSWEEPSLEKRNGFIEGYVIQLNTTKDSANRVRRNTIDSDQSKTIITTGDKRTHHIKDLYADTLYSVQVACYTKAGHGPFGAPVYKKTEEGAPSPPLKPRIITEAEDFKAVAWELPDEPNGHIRKYEIELLKLGTNTSSKLAVNGDIFELNITQLEENTGYLFRVRALTVKNGKWSSWKTLVAQSPKSGRQQEDALKNKMSIIIIAVVCILVLLIALFLLILLRRRRQAKKGRKGQKETEVELLASEQAAEMLDSDDMGIEPEPESSVSHSTDSLQNDGKAEKLDSNPPSSITSDPRHPPIPVGKFPNHVLTLKDDSKRKIREEFKEFRFGQVYSWDTGVADENKWKNRYGNMVSYDHSRVVLKPISAMPGGTDYINATYIDSYSRAKAYIATQGPLDSTSMDFWQMLWNEKSTIIVALTRLEEGGKQKCYQYWPSEVGSPMVFGDINVALLSVDQTADYTIRSFEVTKDGKAESRLVYHFHFLSWPDHGAPDYPAALLSLRRRVRHHMSPKIPVIVHCSAGVGRSGCFILVDAMLDKIAKEKEGMVDVYNYMQYLRTRRINMVQTEEQYTFVHDAILEALTCGNTEIPLDEVAKVLKKFRDTETISQKNGFNTEFLKLTYNCPDIKPEQCSGALKPCNVKKNRNIDILPKDGARVFLSPLPGDFDSTYINAVYADGYRERGLFILAEAPMKHTISSFWQMIEERQCNTIVMLNCLREFAEVYPRFWPMEESPAIEEFGDYAIEMLSEQMDGDLMSRRLQLMSIHEDFEPREVQLYQYLAWPHRDIPESKRDILNLISRVEGTQRRLGNGPIVVTCSDGAGRSGTFVSIYNSIERVKVEQLIDIFQCVRSLRLIRQGAVETLDQYTFIYEMMGEYLDSFDTFEKFK